MRTLAPIRVRRCDCDEHCKFQVFVCRLCGREDTSFGWRVSLGSGLRHLRNIHPWPWASAQLDTDGSGK